MTSLLCCVVLHLLIAACSATEPCMDLPKTSCLVMMIGMGTASISWPARRKLAVHTSSGAKSVRPRRAYCRWCAIPGRAKQKEYFMEGVCSTYITRAASLLSGTFDSTSRVGIRHTCHAATTDDPCLKATWLIPVP